jgi:hypothetical protein
MIKGSTVYDLTIMRNNFVAALGSGIQVFSILKGMFIGAAVSTS